ncbi:MAG: hypothetical protein CMD02_01845 [Flavobacteriales bacterium]|nr:hypothetical protein [Flavobacteriales bacterium]|tara:strand:- start:1149 stop:1670 length:522 start_codon:yes stop_codon:yes gene_type:complete
MFRRLKFFSAGALISILLLTIGPENRLQNTFNAYLDYFNPEKRVVSQLSISDSIVLPTEISEEDFNNILKGAWVNNKLSDKDSYPQKFVLDNLVAGENVRLTVQLFDKEEKKDSLANLKRYTKSEIISLEKGVELSKRSYNSYFSLIGMFLLIMVPVSLLTRKMILKRSLQED